ncbi:MAG TPA: carboxypeptidase M32 [Kofleriaceae bacterium]|nr:carboxypeptidase M32 [Kofleriaceae bacterium]
MSAESATRELLLLHRERALLESCSALLDWDAETYLPPGGVDVRAEQQALLARLEHERAADPRIADLLAEAESGAADPVTAANLRELRREHDRARLAPASLIEDLARETTRAQGAWEEARATGDASGYLLLLERVVALTRAHADCLRGAGGRYDACLDHWEPGLTAAALDGFLLPLRARLVELADRAAGGPRAPHLVSRPVPEAAQRDLLAGLVARLGFDFAGGRLDEAAHPSTVRIGPGDIRLTTRLHAMDPLRGLFSTLHELGHGLYDQNLPPEHFATPIGESTSLALHESQARLIENHVGRSPAFWRWFLPQLAAIVPELAGRDPADALRSVHRVERTASRSGADEVTYDLHIAVRVDLERALIDGDLATADLPAAWDEAYRRTLVAPRHPGEGFLQDSHWAAGMFGYFPTYTLGNLIAAQLFAAAPAIDEELERGSIAPLVDWLCEHIHRHGGLLSSAEIVERATGRPLSIDAQLAHLEARYRAPV